MGSDADNKSRDKKISTIIKVALYDWCVKCGKADVVLIISWHVNNYEKKLAIFFVAPNITQ